MNNQAAISNLSDDFGNSSLSSTRVDRKNRDRDLGFALSINR